MCSGGLYFTYPVDTTRTRIHYAGPAAAPVLCVLGTTGHGRDLTLIYPHTAHAPGCGSAGHCPPAAPPREARRKDGSAVSQAGSPLHPSCMPRGVSDRGRAGFTLTRIARRQMIEHQQPRAAALRRLHAPCANKVERHAASPSVACDRRDYGLRRSPIAVTFNPQTLLTSDLPRCLLRMEADVGNARGLDDFRRF